MNADVANSIGGSAFSSPVFFLPQLHPSLVIQVLEIIYFSFKNFFLYKSVELLDDVVISSENCCIAACGLGCAGWKNFGG